MLFWVIAALMTLAASLALMRPFLRGAGTADAVGEHDLAVYRDQLAELERDRAGGLIGEAEAAEARAEIGRRILRLKGQGGGERKPAGRGRLPSAIAVAAILAVPVLSWGIYGVLGSPGLPSLPLAARLAKDPAEASLDELIARAEGYLAEHPDDARGWEVLAPIYARLGRFADAAEAYRKTIALAGSTAGREAALGEVLVGMGGGIVTAEAEAAFDRALALDEQDARARFYLAMARAQEGKAEEARAAWQEMAEKLPEDSPWKGAAHEALASLAGKSGAPEASAAPGPSAEDIEAARDMTPEARRSMIEGMVASLDAKLRDDPADTEGWRRLLRSYVVLGRKNEAVEALARATAALGPESAEAKSLSEFADELGIVGKE